MGKRKKIASSQGQHTRRLFGSERCACCSFTQKRCGAEVPAGAEHTYRSAGFQDLDGPIRNDPKSRVGLSLGDQDFSRGTQVYFHGASNSLELCQRKRMKQEEPAERVIV